MGQYKVPQDVEAEDKIVGSLTLRQFIFAIIGVGWGLVSFAILRDVPILFTAFGLPPAVLFLALGLFKRGDQPFEALFLALLNFLVQSRKRIWVKEPIAEVFKIEQPKPVFQEPTKDLEQVRGQLEKLAQIVDTRGWSVKQTELQEPTSEPTVNLQDRIVAQDVIATPVQPIDVHAADDMLDMQNNPQAQNISSLVENHVKSIREEAIEKLKHQPAKTKAQPAITNPGNAILKPDYDDLSVAQVAAQVNKQAVMAEGTEVRLRSA